MANIRIDLDAPVVHGREVTFKSPASCCDVQRLVVYYPNNGSTQSKTFQFADAHGNNVGGKDLFASNVLVRVILDTELNRAYVQNADTNTYLENKFGNHSQAASTIEGLATVATSGSYNDLSNKPSIPSAYTHPSTHAASMITAGTFAGQVVAKSDAQTPGTSLLRNSKLVSADTNPSNNGEINWTYE